jgi:hypothetical protein
MPCFWRWMWGAIRMISYAQFKSLFNEVNGSSVSHGERKKYDDGVAGRYQAVSLTYGEISFVTFATIIEMCKPQAHEVNSHHAAVHQLEMRIRD